MSTFNSVTIKARITTPVQPVVGQVVNGQADGRPIRTSPITAIQPTTGGLLVRTQHSVYFVQPPAIGWLG